MLERHWLVRSPLYAGAQVATSFRNVPCNKVAPKRMPKVDNMVIQYGVCSTNQTSERLRGVHYCVTYVEI